MNAREKSLSFFSLMFTAKDECIIYNRSEVNNSGVETVGKLVTFPLITELETHFIVPFARKTSLEKD